MIFIRVYFKLYKLVIDLVEICHMQNWQHYYLAQTVCNIILLKQIMLHVYNIITIIWECTLAHQEDIKHHHNVRGCKNTGSNQNSVLNFVREGTNIDSWTQTKILCINTRQNQACFLISWSFNLLIDSYNINYDIW